MSAWDEVDRLRKEAAEKHRRENAPWLPRPDKTMSADRVRTLRAETRIANGFHPHGARLLGGLTDETCGNCAHMKVKRYSGTYFKCGLLKDANGPGSDVRKKWPACVSWKAKDGAP